MVTVGSAATGWMNDGVFGDGWHLFGSGSGQYEEAAETYGDTDQILDAFISEYGNDSIADAIDLENEDCGKDSSYGAGETDSCRCKRYI